MIKSCNYAPVRDLYLCGTIETWTYIPHFFKPDIKPTKSLIESMELLFVRAFYFSLYVSIYCHAFIQQRNIAAEAPRFLHIRGNNLCHSFARNDLFALPLQLRPAILGRQTAPTRCRRNDIHSFQFLSTYGHGNDGGQRSGWLRFQFLERSHEKLIYVIFCALSTSALRFAAIHCQIDGLLPIEPGIWLSMVETSLALTWSSMILTISFLEAWTKFRAPFLKKYIAVDVGRFVFAALNAAELGIVSSFWLHRTFQCYQIQKFLGGDLFYKGKSYYEQYTFALPAVASLSLLLQVILVAPKLYRRAKRKILDGFDEALPSVKVSMTVAEQAALTDIARDLRRVRKTPSRAWHSIYIILEMIKIGCLNAFVILTWFRLLK
jgi:hypothetical protein